MTITLRVYNNGDHSCIVWKPDARIDNCLGFAIRHLLLLQPVTSAREWVA